MSRRKQEKPQPRKILVKSETGVPDLVQDLLTCGVCQKDFPLCDIVRFIQHKVQSCNKENACHGLFGCGDSDGEDLGPLAHPLLAPLHPTSIKKEDPSAVVSSSSLKNNNALAKDKATSVKDLNPSEPRNYVCSTCTHSHASAWALLQHVQNQHGLKIYVDPCSSSSSSDKNEGLSSSERLPTSQDCGTRAPLLEKQLDPVPLFPRPASQELHLELLGLSSTSNHAVTASSSPPLLTSPQQQKDSKSQSGASYEPQLDFYSQRLRELAGATSPNASVTSSPVKLLQPSFKAIVSQKPTTPERPQPLLTTVSQQTPTHLPQSSASSTTSENPPTSPKQSNPKSCEFCGKSFRFQSNLIVHRRSHTGEKPFKCHICNHACTQASKLKRHMKTHRRKKKRHSTSEKPLALDANAIKNGDKNGLESECWSSNSQTKIHTNGGSEYVSDNENEELEDDDEEIDVEEDFIEEEECEEEEEIVDADAELDDSPKKLVVDQSALESCDDMVAEDLTKKRLNNGTSSTENGKESKEEEEEQSVDRKPLRHSLLSEVMEKIGLANIQQYNEAYKQALKESSNMFKQERHSDGSASNDDNNALERPARDGTRSAGQSPLNFGAGLLSAFDQSMGIKRLRIDDHWRDRERENNLYAGLWIPAVSHNVSSTYKDLYSADGHDRRKTSTAESALLNTNSMSPGSSSPRPGPSSSSLCGSMGSIAGSLLRPKDQRRNDTCEFCGKVFKNCSNLTVHRRSHTGEKPYKCELCSYACAQSSKLTRHMKTHGRIGKDVYRCRFCDMPFSVPSTLEKHMRKCVVSQSGGSSLFLSERDSDSKEMTS